MARDYKPRPKAQKPPQRDQGPARRWPWMLSGLAIGLGIAYGVHVYHTGHLPGTAIASAASAQAEASSDSRLRVKREASRTRFEFYSLLPEMEVVVPESEVTLRTRQPAREDNSTHTADRGARARYIVQAGAFRNLPDADRLRANLALSGLEATIQTVAVDGHVKWHRVRLGPFSNLDALHDVRAKLRRASIDAMVLEIKI